MKPTAWCINLDRRKDRWETMRRVWGPWFELIRFPAIDTSRSGGARGCKWSHWLLACEQLKHEQDIIVLEDDCEITPAFEQIGMDCISDARKYREAWDACCCGPYLDLTAIGMKRAVLIKCSSPLFLKSDYAHNTHMMIYNRRSLPLLESSLKQPIPIDMWIAWHAKDLWVPIRLLATQSDSPSDIPKPNVNAAELYAISERMLEAVVPDEDLFDRVWQSDAS